MVELNLLYTQEIEMGGGEKRTERFRQRYMQAQNEETRGKDRKLNLCRGQTEGAREKEEGRDRHENKY